MLNIIIRECFEFDLIFREHYFTSATWISSTEISVVWLNRPQNVSVVTICKSPMWICMEVQCTFYSILILPKVFIFTEGYTERYGTDT